MKIPTIEELKYFYKGSKVLVTGYNGFKGTWLSLWLKHLGATVFGVGLEPGKLATDVRLDSIVDGRLITDIGYDYPRLEKAMMDFQPDVVFHLAAQPLVRLSYDDPRGTYQTNVMGTMNVLTACVAADIQSAVFITTDKCYENNESGYPMRETDRFGGSDPYSSSKGCCEILIESMRRSFPIFCGPYFSARAGNVIGGGDWAEDRIVPDFFRARQDHKPLLLRNPNSVRPWQHVLEPLYGYLLLGMRTDDTGFGVNFGPYPNEGHTVGEVVGSLNACLEEANEGMVEITPPEQNDEPKKEAKLLQLDITKAITEIGWKPVLDFKNTIRMTADWYRQATSPDAALQLCKSQIDLYEELLKTEKR